jgi:hypothetical protein
MVEALRDLRTFEVWIYLLLGLGGLFFIRKFVLAWQELRVAAFGLERQQAQARLNRAASILVLLLTIAVAEFVLVSFIAPSVPGANPLLTPTLDLLATPTTTLASTDVPVSNALPATITPTPILQSAVSGCVADSIEIATPQNGQEVSGPVDIVGTANIPNFGFYKFEMKRPEESNWQTLQAGNQVRNQESLGVWDTRRLLPGEYQLSLVVVDNQGQASQPCIVQVRVLPFEETPAP